MMICTPHSKLVGMSFLVLVGCMVQSTFSFVLTPSTSLSPLWEQEKHIVLAAKKPKRSNKSSSSGGGFGKAGTSTSGGGGGGGFGSASSASKPTASVIPFSGHSGSGTKALRKVANQFDSIRKEHGVPACRDVYVRSPLHSPTTFWFVGKIACVPPPPTGSETEDEPIDAARFVQTALLLKRIIFEYSKDQLRPQAMGGKYASALELWLAPGNSEMDVATNKVTLRPVKGSLSDVEITLSASDIGYNPEIYVGEEREKGGLRVERDENGVPTKPAFEPNFSQ